MTTTELLTVRQVCARLGCCRQTVETWLRSGKLRGIRLGGWRWRISAEALEAFLREGERHGQG